MRLLKAYIAVTIAASMAACGGTANDSNGDSGSPAANNVENTTGSTGNTESGSPSVADSDQTSQPSGGDPSKPFAKTLELQGITFVVECDNGGSTNTLKITPKGLEGSNEPIEKEVNGGVTGAEVADLNVDGSPEIYVYSSSLSLGFGSVIGYAANNKKSLSEISIAEPKRDSEDMEGYLGSDEFAVVESTLVRRFPVFDKSNVKAKLTGKTRQIQYKLKAGEAAWQLVIDKVITY